jgi:hypothetical protein
VPLALLVIVNTEDALLTAVHAQPLVVVIVTLPEPPAELNDAVVGDTEYEQPALDGHPISANIPSVIGPGL